MGDGLCTTDDWSTSLAVLYNAIIKLSTLSTPGLVYRGVREDRFRLPSHFLPGGVDGAPADADDETARLLGRTSRFLPSAPARFAGGVDSATL